MAHLAARGQAESESHDNGVNWGGQSTGTPAGILKVWRRPAGTHETGGRWLMVVTCWEKREEAFVRQPPIG